MKTLENGKLEKMTNYIHDFDKNGHIPPHIRNGFENYLVHGLRPGSFIESVLCNNFVGAVQRADHINNNHLRNIADWIMYNMPLNSWGNSENINNWINDVDSIRTNYVNKRKKEKFWNTMENQYTI
jgi:hypothetical protein